MKTKILTITIGLTALALAGCTSTENANANLKNVNSNTAVVVNSNQAPITNSSPTRRDNSNVSKEDYEKNRAEYEKTKGNSKIGTGANDSWLWFKTRAALMATADLRESTIDVDVDNAAVTLRGTVANNEQKKKAEDVAKGIDGVTKVNNQLKVAPNDSMTNTKDADDKKPANANTKK